MSRTGRQTRERLTTRSAKDPGPPAADARSAARRRPQPQGAASLKERLRYRFDNSMSRGPSALVGWLAVATLVLIVVFSLLVLLTQVAPSTDDGERPGVRQQLFNSLMHALDPGTVAGDSGSWRFLLTMLALTIAGLFVVSALIGVIATAIDTRLMELRRGRSRVLEEDHTLILGWSDAVMTILRELSIANESRKKPCVVILAPRDKVEMEEEIRERAGDLRGTRVICRTGSPIDVTDLKIGSHEQARSIIVLAPDGDEPDSEAIKTLLALTHVPRTGDRPLHVVVEIEDPAYLEAARMVAGQGVVIVNKRETVARLIVQTSRQSGAAMVYTELFDFDGDEIYFHDEPRLSQGTYGDALMGYEDCSVIGYADADGAVRLNPPMDTPLDGRELVVIAEDDSALVGARGAVGVVDEQAVVAIPPRPEPPSRILVLGWNERAASVITELDEYASPGSRLSVVSEFGEPAIPAVRNLAVDVAHGRTTDRATLDGLEVQEHDQVIVLCYSDDLEIQRADSRTLVTLLHLREIAALDPQGRKPAIVSEMLDDRNRALAQVAEVDDVIVSDEILSLILAQISEEVRLDAVFTDLLDADGSEIYLRPAAEYVAIGREVTYATVVDAARRRGETAIGYRDASEVRNPVAAYGVRVNPPKATVLTPDQADRVVVLAED
ncbi:CASTOR/POLLUX-related putative ion channel [Patulibacter minatonensis]|uniref:CASTOR/POLLUX-related putative ion channel n=1 Tax=Patulibacter minatonensis TaxID=298163 RepID=UPI00068739DE|nr:NAD-binding protein [Patulibacter minatonensis]